MKKRLIALLLTFALLVSLVPASAFAENPAAPKTEASKSPASDLPFTDVSMNDWFHDAVSYVYHQQIFNGVSDTLFSPRGNMTRAMFVSVLSRMARAEETEFGTESAFSDTKSDFWYTSPINWAVAFKITTGTGNGKFSPNSPVTREQIAVFFARYLDAYGVVLPDSDQVSGPPQDLMSASDWARNDIMTLWKTGLMIGDGKNFNPKKLCTRAEGATMCMRIYDYIRKAQDLLLDYDQEGKAGDDIIGQSDVSEDFTLTLICSDASMGISDVLNSLTAENLTDPEAAQVIQISGGDGVFTISGCHEELGDVLDGFVPGSTYRIALNDPRLSFEGIDESIREYDFTTRQVEVMNVGLSPSVVYLPVTALTDLMQDGVPVQMVDAALFTAGTRMSVNDLTVGSFRYDGSDIGVDSIVAVYTIGSDSDAIPGDETFDGEVGYIKITECSDSTYSYTNAQTEDVLFFPDILPIPASADLNKDGKDNTVELTAKTLDFSSDVYANLGLDSTTIPEPGDYLVFYTGSLTGGNISSYGKILKVEVAGDVYTLTYSTADWDEVSMAMEMYTTEPVSGEELLEETDEEELKETILLQAVESGFAEDAAHYLAAVALETEIDGQSIAGDVLQCYSFTDAQGVPIPEYEVHSAAKKGAVSIGEPELSVEISTHPDHIDSGLHVLLGVGLTISIKPSGIASTSSIEITVNGQFVEELGMTFDITGKAVWDTWGIFPYISDYTVTGNVDVLDYTGINFNATVKTSENTDAYLVNSIADKIEYLLDQLDDADEGYFSDDLAEKYATMIKEDSDLVDLFRVELIKKEFYVPTPLPIINIVLEADFVVKADAVISAGLDFSFTNGKRYVFNFSVLGHTATNDVITLTPDTYDLKVYVMGRLELRAGVELVFQIGLLSTKLDYVGFTADVGAYLDLYGYFYYQYHRVAGSPPVTSWNGALYLEIGVYLKLSFKAEVKGIITTSLTLYEHKWPLWSMGDVTNILDFATPEEEVPEITLKQYIRSAYLPESLFTMNTMDLKTGKAKDINYDDASESKFTISFSNSKFSYDPRLNKVTVNPKDGDVRLETKMTIIYNLAPLAFSSEPIQRTLKISWTNLKDGYVIMPYTNGGNYVKPILQAFETKVTPPANPVRKGYVFDGWYSDEALTMAYTFPENMPAEDASIYARWAPATDTPYTVEHWQQILGEDTYQLIDTEEFTGTTNSSVTPKTRRYTGFTSPEEQVLTITADGAATLRYYYTRNMHTLTFDASAFGSLCDSMKLSYKASVSIPKAAKAGYIFEGWYDNASFTGAPYTGGTMPDEDKTYYAKFVPDLKTLYAYRVEYYFLQKDGSYTKLEGTEPETHRVPAGTKISLASLLSHSTLSGDDSKACIITADGKELDPGSEVAVPADHVLVIKLKYSNKPIEECTLEYPNLTEEEKHGLPTKADSFTNVILPDLSREFYTFGGWYYDEDYHDPVPDEAPDAANTTVTIKRSTRFYARWDANYVQYKLYNGLGDTNTPVAAIQVECGKSRNLPTLSEIQKDSSVKMSKDGCRFGGWGTTQDATDAAYADGAKVTAPSEPGTVIQLYGIWPEIPYMYTLINDVPDACYDFQKPANGSYTVSSKTITLKTPTANPGYEFLGWYDNDTKVTEIPQGSTGERVLMAKWAHAGIFTIQLDSSKKGTSTYKIVRELPKGCERFTADTQQVYYHTQNGTAIGGTATAIHFKHADGFKSFTSSDQSATFTVSGENAAATFEIDKEHTYPATAWTYNADRYYLVELNKVINSTNKIGCTGRLGSDKTYKRVLTQPSEYKLSQDVYKETHAKFILCGKITVTDKSNFSQNFGYSPLDAVASPGGHDTDQAFQDYLRATCNDYRSYITANLKENDDGAQWFRFETYKDNNVLFSTGTFKYSIAGKSYQEYSFIQLPISKSISIENGGGGKTTLDYEEEDTSQFKGVKDGNYWKLVIDSEVTWIKVCLDASGSNDDDWEISSQRHCLEIKDTQEPSQCGCAPVAYGTYYKGDTINIAVYYNEVINSFSSVTNALDLSLLDKAGIKVSSATYLDGIGTNVLVFQCTVSEDFEVKTTSPDTNNLLLNTKPCKYTNVRDIA